MTPAARERARVQAPLLLVSTAAWALLMAGPGQLALHGAHAAHAQMARASAHPHHAHHGSSAAGLELAQAALQHPGSLALGWALMLVAMMLPILAAPIRHVRDRSFPSRRARSTALFLVGYGAVWMLAGAVLIGVATSIASSQRPLLLAGLGTALVVAWQASPFKQACINRLHGHSALRAFGIGADLDASAFGLVHGVWCVGSCWGLMLLPMLFTDGHLVLMTLVSIWVWAEQIERPTPPRWCLRVPLKAVRIGLARARRRPLLAFGPRLPSAGS